MKALNKKVKTTGTKGSKALSPTSVNKHKKSLLIFVCAGISVAACVWVMLLGRDAQSQVDVCMSAKNLYKNEQILDLDTQIKLYGMSKLEYNKYTVEGADGSTRRIFKWDERGQLVGYYMGYYVPEEQILEAGMFVLSKVENSDTVLYAYPGKEIVSLQVGTGDLSSFKTFLTTGDKINIDCTYTETTRIYAKDINGNNSNTDYEDVEQFYTVPVFQNIQIADILNSSGDSVLDLQASYNELSLFEQDALDSDTSYQQKLTPSTILLALTPQEKRQYYKYLSKGGTFRMSLPQRTE